MSIVDSDFCLSGISNVDLERTAKRIIHLGCQIQLSELLVWNRNGQVNRTIFEEGTSIADMEGVIEFDFEVVIRFMCVLHPCLAGVRTTINIAAYPAPNNIGTIIEGQLYLGHVLNKGISPERTLNAFAELLVVLAKRLDTIFLNVADEDDESILLTGSGVRLPSLFGVYNYFLVEGLIEKLQKEGVVIDKSQNKELILIWVAPIAELIGDAGPRKAVLKVLRSHLANAGYD